MNFKNLFYSILAITFTCMSCGGGGGGGSAGGGDYSSATPKIEYTGLTEMADLNEANVKQIVIEAINGGSIPPNPVSFSSLNVTQESSISPIAIIGSLKDFINNLKNQNTSLISAAIQTKSVVIFGTYSGKVDYIGHFDESNPNYIWGEGTFSDYREDDIVLNGYFQLQANVAATTNDITSLTLSFEYLEASYASKQYALKGSISSTFQNSYPESLTVDLYTKDLLTGLVEYNKCAYLVVRDNISGISQLIASDGFYCNPTIGCVDYHGAFNFKANRVFPLGNEDGYSDKFIIEGQGGKMAHLLSYSGMEFKIDAWFSIPAGYIYDNPDYDSGLLLWEDYFDYGPMDIFRDRSGDIVWYQDYDSDGYSNGNSIYSDFRVPNSYLISELTHTSTDCNDFIGAINPGEIEVCNNLDDNCNGQIDEGCVD